MQPIVAPIFEVLLIQRGLVLFEFDDVIVNSLESKL